MRKHIDIKIRSLEIFLLSILQLIIHAGIDKLQYIIEEPTHFTEHMCVPSLELKSLCFASS